VGTGPSRNQNPLRRRTRRNIIVNLILSKWVGVLPQDKNIIKYSGKDEEVLNVWTEALNQITPN
jgi:hypothetical protein